MRMHLKFGSKESKSPVIERNMNKVDMRYCDIVVVTNASSALTEMVCETKYVWIDGLRAIRLRSQSASSQQTVRI